VRYTEPLERADVLGVLRTAVTDAAHGAGSVVLVEGEAGIGKTSVLRAFAAEHRDRVRVLLGGCDDLLTPRAFGPLRDAVAGTDREALAHFSVAVEHQDRLDSAEQARLADDHAWELYNAHRFAEAVQAGERAVLLYRRVGDTAALGHATVRLSRHYYMAGATARAETAARQAVQVLEPTGSTAALAYATTYHGAVLAMVGSPAEAAATLRRADELARRADRRDLVGLGMNYQSIALPGLDGAGRIALLTDSLDLSLRHGHHEHAARGYTNLGELLYRYGRYDALERCLAEGLAFTRDRGFWSHAYNLRVHENLLAMRRGDWTRAEAGLSELTFERDVGMLQVYAEPNHARMLARRADPSAQELLVAAWRHGRTQRSLVGLGYPGTALVEWAWLNDRPDVAASVRDAWREHADRPSAAPMWAEILRYAARAGLRAEPFDDGPEPWAAGLRGDWRTAAAGWERVGDPYEQALELASSGETGPTLSALRILDDLGATAAALRVRRRLRALGVRTIPRGPAASTRAHPAGLTARQGDVLDLIGAGLTNAEIAAKLVLSVRTVDHHVSAILTKLGVASRREAAARASA
jgi:DNA-binding CsgD family transcriptional regulator/tetratricopeptide (TPR) repeat protein